MEQSILEVLIAEGLSSRDIAKRLGTSQTNVRHFLKKYELRTDPKRRSKDRSKSVVNWRQRTKRRAVEYKGGKCVVCGYCKCLRALKFHHLNPEEKDFGIGKVCRSWQTVQKELDKCLLVCGNCHDEIHEGLIETNSVHP